MNIYDNIKGFIHTSLTDWDGKVAAVIFTGGCNFKCVYCHNKELVLEPEKVKSIPFEEIKNFLEKNKEFVDGIVVSGGEPTIYNDLPTLCKEIKNLGFKVKLETNGSNPEMLIKLLDKRLVDSVSMDIKTSFNKYEEIAGDVDIEKVKKSIDIVKKFPEYEFRITLFPGIKKEDLIEITRYLKENNANKAFFVQQFRAENCVDEEAEKVKPYTKNEIEEMHNSVKDFFEKSGIRNVN